MRLSPVAGAEQLAVAKIASENAAGINRVIMAVITHCARQSAATCETGLVIGVDEAGRGPLAGPVVAAAVVQCDGLPAGLDDSKKLSAARRSKLEQSILRDCRWAVGVAEVDEIDEINILNATMLAMTRAVAALCGHEKVGNVLIDGNMTPHGRSPDWRWAARAIVGGDGLEPCISAASIVAKEHRDRIMRKLAAIHPLYGWEHNMGYGTRQHLDALRLHGPTPHHRRSFAPVAQCELRL